jgi:predicted nuclease of restriction endonuclease-like RecB superfamily
VLSQSDLPLRLLDDRAYLEYLGAQDEPWLRVLVAEMQRFEGRRRRELAERLAEPLPCDAPYFKRRAASRVLFRIWNRAGDAAAAASAGRGDVRLRPAAIRAALFGGAAANDSPRDAILAATAVQLGAAPDALEAALFADLPGERPVRAPDPVPTPAEIALHTNLALAQTVVMRAAHVALRVEGNLRPIVRLAKFRGLICSVSAPAPGSRPRLDISGPFSLFRHTLVYGRALAELVPHLAWCARFELAATARLRGRLAQVTMESGDPIFPARAPASFDSRLEERFAKDVARLAPDWDVIREPVPLQAGATLIFPDFLLRHRIHTERQALVEIVGFWTPDYLREKLARLRQVSAVAPPAFIICIDEERGCAPSELPPGLPVVTFRHRVDAAAVMREVERLTANAEPDGALRSLG